MSRIKQAEIEEFLKDDIPMKSFIKKGRSTSETLMLCEEENDRRLRRDLYKLTMGERCRQLDKS